MAAEGVPHFLEGEGSHWLALWSPTLLSSPSLFCNDRNFHQLDAALPLGINNLILSCGKSNVRISEMELETFTVSKIIVSIE